ncbi:hypothetical protein ACFL45_10255 [Candidatus Neomarinimicrobiota bacterium]
MGWALIGVGEFVNILAIIAGMMVWGLSSRPIRLLTIFLVLNLLTDISAIVMGRLVGHNLILLNIYELIEYPIIAIIFSYWLDGKARIFTLLSAPVFPVLCVFLHLSDIEDLLGPGSYFTTIKGLLVGLIVVRTLYSLMIHPKASPIQRTAPFWITIGTFFLATCGVAVYAAIPEQITVELWTIHIICVINAYLLYIRGFWCLWEKEGSTPEVLQSL